MTQFFLHDSSPTASRLSWLKGCDSLIHENLKTDRDQLHRSRILVANIIVFATLVGLTSILLWFREFPVFAKASATVLSLSFVATLLLVLWHIKQRGHYVFASNALVYLDLIAIIFGLGMSGGISSPTTQLLIDPILFAYFYAGARSGAIATLVVLLVAGVFYLLELSGVPIFSLTPPEQKQSAFILVSYLNIATITAVAAIYRITAENLEIDRDNERQHIMRMAHTDALTNLPNRRSFDQVLQQHIDNAENDNPDAVFALCYLDLNGFKQINDEYGHSMGDYVLQEISSRLSGKLRKEDYIGRQGGDEFTLLLPSVDSQEKIDIIAERLAASINKPIVTTIGKLQVTASLGFALYPQDASSAESLKKFADNAMYEFKAASKPDTEQPAR